MHDLKFPMEKEECCNHSHMRVGMKSELVPQKVRDYTWRPYTTPNTHNPHGKEKDILHNLGSVGYLDNQEGGLWSPPGVVAEIVLAGATVQF